MPGPMVCMPLHILSIKKDLFPSYLKYNVRNVCKVILVMKIRFKFCSLILNYQ